MLAASDAERTIPGKQFVQLHHFHRLDLMFAASSDYHTHKKILYNRWMYDIIDKQTKYFFYTDYLFDILVRFDKQTVDK